MMSNGVFLQKFKGDAIDSKHKIILKTPNSVVSGFINSDLNISMGADWNAPDNDGGVGTVNAFANSASRLGATMGLTEYSNQRITSAMDSVLHWQSSQYVTVTLDILLVAVNNDDDLTAIFAELLAAVYPEQEVTGVWVTYTAPGKFGTDLKGNATGGTCALKVGEYFKMSGLVLQSVNASFSKSLLKSGKPAQVNISCSLMTYKVPMAGEVENYFI